MHRFFVTNIHGPEARLALEDIPHAVKVLRLREGDEVLIGDGQNGVYPGRIVEASAQDVRVGLGARQAVDAEPSVYMVLFQALIKGAKLEWVLQKGVELGLSEFRPFVSERSVARDAQKELRGQRYERIVRHAAMQSERGILPSIAPCATAAEAAKALAGLDAAILLYERQDISLKHVLASLTNVKRLGLIVGPEGGFSDGEAKRFMDAGAKPAGLGKLILRAETAGVAAAAMVRYHYDYS